MSDSLDRQQQLFAACAHGELNTVQAILEQDDSGGVDSDGGEGFTPLQVAAGNGHVDIVRLLLVRGASLDRQNLYGWTALMQAASQGHVKVVALLLQNKADPNIKNKLGATALTAAAHYGHATVVKILLNLDAIDLNEAEKGNVGQAFTPLMLTVLNSNKQVMLMLLDRGANQFQVHPQTGWTLLMMASLSGNASIVKKLVETRGCAPDATNILNRTALEIAIMKDHREVQQYLDPKTKKRPQLVTENSKPKIIEATESGDIKLVQSILDADPKQCNKLSPEGASPLMIAAIMGRADIAELLVQRGADVNMQDSMSGWTALMQATYHRRIELVKFLIDVGADVNIRDKDGYQALDFALFNVTNKSDSSGNELISLLAAMTMPMATKASGDKSLQSHGTSSSTWSTKTNTSQLSDEDFPRNGLKAWWSRMSNRFRNLKLSRTFRVGLSTTQLTPFEDGNSPSSSGTMKGTHDAKVMNAQEDDGRHRRKKSQEGALELNQSRNSVGQDSGLDVSMHSTRSLSILLPVSQQPNDKLLPVVPPFLPPPSFELKTSDRSRRSHHITKDSRTKLASEQDVGSSRLVGKPPTKLMFSRRSSGISPNSSAHYSTTASPNSSAEAAALSRGLKKVRRSSLNLQDGAGTSKFSSVAEPLFTHVSSLKAMKHSNEQQSSSEPTCSKDIDNTREPPLPITPPASTGSTSSTASDSLTRSKPHPVSDVSHSSSPTLTPSPSPMGAWSGVEPHHSEVKREDSSTSSLQKNTSSSSGISEDDELSALLRKLSLEKYAQIFEEQEVDMEAFLSLNESDLKEMGISKTGPLQQILGAITELNDGKHVKKYPAPTSYGMGYGFRYTSSRKEFQY